MWRRLNDLLGLIKFSHTLFALPFALLGAALAAHGRRRAGTAARSTGSGILLCMATARSAAMAFNRLVDRRVRRPNPRTAGRHLPAGRSRSGPWPRSRVERGGVRRLDAAVPARTAGR